MHANILVTFAVEESSQKRAFPRNAYGRTRLARPRTKQTLTQTQCFSSACWTPFHARRNPAGRDEQGRNNRRSVNDPSWSSPTIEISQSHSLGSLSSQMHERTVRALLEWVARCSAPRRYQCRLAVTAARGGKHGCEARDERRGESGFALVFLIGRSISGWHARPSSSTA